MHKIIRAAALSLAGLGLITGSTVAALPASAAAKPYHIRSANDSWTGIDIWTDTTCSTGGHWLLPGDDATSTGWKSFETHNAGPMTVTVYDGSTGALLATRYYENGECVKAYASNDYRASEY
jgi:hypothetical protein